MSLTRLIPCLAAVGVLTLVAAGHAQAPADKKVELKAVKYSGLTDLVLNNKGKVVLVDFWHTL